MQVVNSLKKANSSKFVSTEQSVCLSYTPNFSGKSVNKDTYESANKQDKKTFAGHVKDFFEKTILKLGTVTKHVGMPVSGELLKLSLMSDEKRTKLVSPTMGHVLNPSQSKDFLASLNMFEGSCGHTTPEQMKLQTVLFSKDSEVAKNVNSNKALKDKIKAWVDNGEKSGEHIGFNTADSGSFDLRMGLGFSKIVGLHRTEDGSIEGYVEDVYDFDKVYAKGKHEEDNFLKKIKSKSVQMINNMAYDLQENGKLRPYRCLIPVKVTV